MHRRRDALRARSTRQSGPASCRPSNERFGRQSRETLPADRLTNSGSMSKGDDCVPWGLAPVSTVKRRTFLVVLAWLLAGLGIGLLTVVLGSRPQSARLATTKAQM